MPHPPSYLRALKQKELGKDKEADLGEWVEESKGTRKRSWLFAITAKQGTIFKSKDEYALEIATKDMSQVVAFTDRPFRTVEVITSDKLAGLWKNSEGNSFEEDPPNASLASAGTPLDIIEIMGSTSGHGKLSFPFKYLNVSQRGSGPIRDIVLTIDNVYCCCATGAVGSCFSSDG